MIKQTTIQVWWIFLVVASTLIHLVYGQAQIDSVNSFSAPFHFGIFDGGAAPFVNLTCGPTGATCFVSIQQAYQCEQNTLTVPDFTVGSGSSSVLQILQPSRLASYSSLYELCLHATPATAYSTRTNFFFSWLPTLSTVATLRPFNRTQQTAGSTNRPFVVLPFQPRGTFTTVAPFNAVQYNISIVLGSAGLTSNAVLYAALLPTCSDSNLALRSYLANAATSTPLPLSFAAVRMLTATTFAVTIDYLAMYHLWNMLDQNVSGTVNSNVREGAVCLGLRGFVVNSSLTQAFNGTSSYISFPIDLGISIRLASGFRLAGQSVMRVADTGVSSATPDAMYLVANARSTFTSKAVVAARSPFSFDTVTPQSDSLSAIASGLRAINTTTPSLFSIAMDLRDPAFPCEGFTTSSLQNYVASVATLDANPRYQPLFATGSYASETSLVSWNVLINVTFPGNQPSSYYNPGSAEGMLCIFVTGVPILTTHLVGRIFTILIDSPGAVFYAPRAPQWSPAYTTAFADDSSLASVALLSVLQQLNVDITFNLTAYAPSIASMRFVIPLEPSASCASLNASSWGVASTIVKQVFTRFLTLDGSQWLNTSFSATLGLSPTSLRRLCVAIVTNTTDAATTPYYFQDLSIPLRLVLMPFGSFGSSPSDSLLSTYRVAMVPTNVPTFALPLISANCCNTVMTSSTLSLSFALTVSGCSGLVANTTSTLLSNLTTVAGLNEFTAGISPQLNSITFPAGSFASQLGAFVCYADSSVLASPRSMLPVAMPGFAAVFFTMDVAAKPASTPLSKMLYVSGGSLASIYVDPVNGLQIPITLAVRAASNALGSSTEWTLTRVLSSVRLSASNSQNCSTANGASQPLNLVTQYTSVLASDSTAVMGYVSASASYASSLTGLRYLCFTTARLSTLQQFEAFSSRPSFPLGIFKLTMVNGVNVTSGMNTSVTVGAIQFVTFQWEVIGAGFNSVSQLYFRVGSTLSDAVSVINDTYATFSFVPQVFGNLTVQVSAGLTLQYLSYSLFTMDVIGVASIGKIGGNVVVMFSGQQATTFPIALTSTVAVFPQMCLATAVDSFSSICTCDAQAMASFSSASTIVIDLSATNSTTFVGDFVLCFRHSSSVFYATKSLISVVPRITSVGGVSAIAGGNATLSILRATAPNVVVGFVAAPPASTSVSSGVLTLVIWDITFSNVSATCEDVGTLPENQTLISVSDLMSVTLSSSSSTLSGVMTVAITNRNLTSNLGTNRRLCASVFRTVTISNTSNTIPLNFLTTDLGIRVDVGTLSINGIAINNGLNTTLPIVTHFPTVLNVTLPSFVSNTTFLKFGLASDSCDALPLQDSDSLAMNQSVSITNLTLSYDVSQPFANLTIPSGVVSSTADVLLCGRWLASARYTFSGLLLSTIQFTALDGQSLTAASNYLSASSGVAFLKNSTRIVVLTGVRLGACCVKLALKPSSSTGCTDAANTMFVGSIAQTTQQFSLSSASAVDFPSMCFLVMPSCSSVDTHLFVYVDVRMPVSALRFSSFDIDSTALTNLNQQQSELLAIVGITMTNTLYALDSYTLGSVSTLPFVAIGLQSSSVSNCDVHSFLHSFPIQQVTSASGSLTLAIQPSFPTSVATNYTTFTMCVLRNTSSTQQLTMSIGMRLLLLNLTVGGALSGVAQTLSLTVGKAPELVVTGTNLNLALIYVSLTDLATCAGSTLTGTSAVGIDRSPSTVVSCSSSQGSVAFSSASSESTTPLSLCISGIATSSGKATASSLTFYNYSVRVVVTQSLKLTVVTQPSSVASSDMSLRTSPVLGIFGSGNVLVQNIPSGIVISAYWVAIDPYVAVESSCDSCKITTTGESFLLSSATNPSLFSNAKFGVQYVLQYSTDRANIEAVNTSSVIRGSCSANQFGQMYSTQCVECPATSYCTGSVDYTLRFSYWRPNNRTNFVYDCSAPYAAAQCLANTSTGTCVEGHHGPRCSICDPGYGKSFDVCVPCGSYWQSLATVVSMAVGYVLLVIFATFSSVTGMDDVRESNHLPMLIKLMTSHLSVASTVGQFSSQFPTLLSNLFGGMRSSSRPSPQFAALDCSIAPTAYQSFLFLILIPIPTLFLVLGGSFFVRLLHHLRDKSHDVRKKEAETLRISIRSKRYGQSGLRDESMVLPSDAGPQPAESGVAGLSRRKPFAADGSSAAFGDSSAMQSSGAFVHVSSGAADESQPVPADAEILEFDPINLLTEEERQLEEEIAEIEVYEKSRRTRLDTKTLFMLALVVVLLFAYPTIVEQSLNMLKCDVIDFGELMTDLTFKSDIRKLYFYDRSLDCTSSDHQFYSLLAYLAVVAYGIGIPVASILLILYFRKTRGADYTNRLFVFLVSGYDEDRWWWETMILWRKLALAFVLVFVDDQRLQTYFALWILMIALALQLWLEPYDEVHLDRLATSSLSIVIVTLNLSLLYDYVPSTSSSTSILVLNWVLTAFLFVINSVIIFVLGGLIVLHILLEVQHQISTNQKVIRKVFPRALQLCLFRFARKPIMLFHKILKKRERQREKKNRLQHVINDAEEDVIEVVVADKSAAELPKGVLNELSDLKDKLKTESDLLRDVMQRYEALLKARQSDPSDDRGMSTLDAELRDLERLRGVINDIAPQQTKKESSERPTPLLQGLLSTRNSTLGTQQAGLSVMKPPELVIEDLTTLPGQTTDMNALQPALSPGGLISPAVQRRLATEMSWTASPRFPESIAGQGLPHPAPDLGSLKPHQAAEASSKSEGLLQPMPPASSILDSLGLGRPSRSVLATNSIRQDNRKLKFKLDNSGDSSNGTNSSIKLKSRLRAERVLAEGNFKSTSGVESD